MVFQLLHVFWTNDCDGSLGPDPARVKRLADINTDTQVGGGRINEGDTYTLINIHGPTAAWMLGGMAALAVLAVAVWFLYRRRQRKMKRIVMRHRQARWEAIGYHKSECNKIDHTKECDCRKDAYHPRRASNGGDIVEPGYKGYPIDL